MLKGGIANGIQRAFVHNHKVVVNISIYGQSFIALYKLSVRWYFYRIIGWAPDEHLVGV